MENEYVILSEKSDVKVDNYENVDNDVPEFVNIPEIKHFIDQNEDGKNYLKSNKIAHVCDYCSKEFKTHKALTIHIRVHTNERPYKCKTCEKAFKQLNSLNSHMVTHTKTKAYSCQFCSGAYTTASSLKRHIKRMHQTGRNLECGACSEKFYNIASLREHKFQQHPEHWQQIECSICKRVLQSSVSYRKHVNSIHGQKKLRKIKSENSYKFICSLCGEQIYSVKTVRVHNNEHIQYTKKDISRAFVTNKYPCKICRSEFANKSSLMQHVGRKHMEKNLECKECDLKYSYIGLKDHKRNVHRKFECNTCKEVFQGRSMLKIHRLKCHPNNVITSDKRQPQINQYNKFNKQRQNIYKCQICGQILYGQKSLTPHLRLKHNESKQNYCKMCKKSFKLFASLQKHNTSIHFLRSDKKIYFCKRCCNHYTNITSYVEHMKQHRIKKRFKCASCQKYFSSLKCYHKHMKSKGCLDNRKSQAQPLYTCTVCNKSFSKEATLTSHVLMHTLSCLTCRFCGIEYKKLISLKIHMAKYHHGENIFHCKHCNLGFDSTEDVKNHHRVNHEDHREADQVKAVVTM